MLYLIRAVSLDSDLPGYELSTYMLYDEEYYAQDAINLVRSEIVSSQDEVLYGEYPQWHTGNSCLTTLACMISLSLLGNTYYGLRASMVILGAVIILLFWLTLKGKDNLSDSVRIIALLFLLANYGFFQACRVVEPSLARGLTVLLIPFFCAVSDKRSYFGLGVLSSLTLILGYSSNIFTVAAVGLVFVVEHIISHERFKTFIRNGLIFIAGIAVGYIGGEVIYRIIQGRFFFSDFITLTETYQGGMVSFSVSSMIRNAMYFFQGNMFIFSPLLALLLPVSTAWNLAVGLRENNRQRLIESMLVILWFAECLLVSDFIERKSILILPIVLLCISDFVSDWDKVKNHLLSCKSLRKYIVFLVTFCTFAFVCLSMTKRISNIPEDMFSKADKTVLLCFGVVQCLVLSIYVLKVNRKILIYALVTLCVIPNLLMDLNVVFLQPKSEKESMEELGRIVGETYVLGGLSYSYSLYNDIVPMFSMYDSYLGDTYDKRAEQVLKNSDVKYYLGLKGDQEHIDTWLSGTDYHWEMVKQFETGYRYDNAPYDMDDLYLYEKVE